MSKRRELATLRRMAAFGLADVAVGANDVESAAHPQRHRYRVDAGSTCRGQRDGICASSYSQRARWVVRRTPDRFRDV